MAHIRLHSYKIKKMAQRSAALFQRMYIILLMLLNSYLCFWLVIAIICSCLSNLRRFDTMKIQILPPACANADLLQRQSWINILTHSYNTHGIWICACTFLILWRNLKRNWLDRGMWNGSFAIHKPRWSTKCIFLIVEASNGMSCRNICAHEQFDSAFQFVSVCQPKFSFITKF